MGGDFQSGLGGRCVNKHYYKADCDKGYGGEVDLLDFWVTSRSHQPGHWRTTVHPWLPQPQMSPQWPCPTPTGPKEFPVMNQQERMLPALGQWQQ